MTQTPLENDANLVIHTVSLSDVGQVRTLNEDSTLTLNLTGVFESSSRALGLFAVADGMGGHSSGEVASRESLRVLAHETMQRIFSLYFCAARPYTLQKLSRKFARCVSRANDHLCALREKEFSDMGTTLSALLIVDDLAIIANVGDSRTYLWRANILEKLTNDHSIVATLIAAGQLPPEEVYTHPQKNIIYRSLGEEENVSVDIFSTEIAIGDRFLLCSDGLWEMVRDDGITEILTAELPLQETCTKLVAQANREGGEDNISAVLVEISVPPPTSD